MHKILFPFLGFNSTLVQLKVAFYKLTIIIRACFNSTLVQLKDCCVSIIFSISESFNSTLVQLKGIWSLRLKKPLLRFNSTLVQLKAVKNANKYTSKSMIYHPFILIFYKHLQSTFNS